MPVLIGICGAGSGSGKTTMAEALLKEASKAGLLDERSPWGVVKFTKTGIYTSVVTDSSTLLEEGKDTSRMLKAGACRAVWVSSPGGDDLGEALEMAIDEMRGFSAVLVEGNSAVELLNPNIVIFMSGPVFKSGAESTLRLADVVYRPTGAVLPSGPDVFKKDVTFCGEIASCAAGVLERWQRVRGRGKS